VAVNVWSASSSRYRLALVRRSRWRHEYARLTNQRHAVFAHAGFDAVDLEPDVDAIDDRLFVGIVLHEVAAEEADGLSAGRCGQADSEGVEILQHWPPQIVDGAVALIDDDEIEALNRDVRVVFQRHGFSGHGRGLEHGAVFVGFVELLVAAEHGVQPLNGRDDNLGGRVDDVAAQVLDDVFLGELVAAGRADELLKLVQRLLAEIPAIDEEENAFGPACLISRWQKLTAVNVLPEPVAI